MLTVQFFQFVILENLSLLDLALSGVKGLNSHLDNSIVGVVGATSCFENVNYKLGLFLILCAIC